MAGNPLGSIEERKSFNALHGVGGSRSVHRHSDNPQPRPRIPIDVPKQGSTSSSTMSSHVHAKHSRRQTRKSIIPSHTIDFIDNLDENSNTGMGGSSLGTARRMTSRSHAFKRAPSPDSPARVAQPPSPSNGISVIIPKSTRSDKGKGKDHDLGPSTSRATRSKSLRKASQSEVINIPDDDDDDGIEPVITSPSTNHAPKHSSDVAYTSPALLAKAKRRKTDASISLPAFPRGSFARPNNQRPEGTIQLEQARSGSQAVHVLSPEPESGTANRPDHCWSEKKGQKMIDRMKPRSWATAQPDPPNGPPSTTVPSPVLLQRSQTTHEQSSSSHRIETNGASQLPKRRRTETAHRSPEARRNVEAFSLPLEVRLDAIVVSDVWRSRDDARPFALFNNHSLHLGLKTENKVQIQYNDIRQVFASTEDVNDYATLCFTLRHPSESAKRMQENFAEFDPRASDDAAEIQLIARNNSADLERHKCAVALINKRLQDSAADSVRWLIQPGAKSKIGSVASVTQSPWPQLERAKRVLIVPGSGREQSSDARHMARTVALPSPQQPKKKTFDIQPASPESGTGGIVDVDMPDATASSSPTLPSLVVPKSKLATYGAPKAESREILASSSEQILQYPYEGIGAVSMYGRDFERLLDGQLLNDIVIEFGLKFMLGEIRARDPDLADSIYVFNTFFWKVLMDEPTVEQSYRKLRRWTSKVDLFSKKYIVVPINEDYHWYLALIVNPGLMFVEQDKDSGSEQDKEEVASALMTVRKPATLPSASDSASRDDHAGRFSRENDKCFSSSEPSTPPLPSSHLPTHLAGTLSSSSHVPMNVDRDSRASTPTKSAFNAEDLSRTFVITFDSLGSKHPKVGNKLHEYLWREALDKNRLTVPLLAKLVGKQEAKKAARQEDETRLTSGQDATQRDPTSTAKDVSMDEAQDEAQDEAKVGGMESTKEAAGDQDGIRFVQVQDSRQPTETMTDKLTEAETLAKSLPKTSYIAARVPTQPNFCDCGIYLLHYFDRFFHDPDKRLELVVKAKSKLNTANKIYSVRKQYRDEVGKSIESEWQAGEVSKKREYWRRTVGDLSKGWKAYNEAAKAAESVAKQEEEEEEPEPGEEKQSTKNAAQQKQPEVPQVANVSMTGAQQAVTPAEKPIQEVAKGSAAAEKRDGLGPEHRGSCSDIEQSVSEYALGQDRTEKQYVDSVLAEALSKQKGPLTREHLFEPQREEQKQDYRKTPSEWVVNFRNNDSSASQLVPMEAISLPVGNERKEEGLLPSAVSNPSPASQQFHYQQQKQVMPPSFGTFMLAQSASNCEPPPSLPFGVSNNHPRVREEEEGLLSDGRDSSASVAGIVVPSSSSSTSDPANRV